VENPAPRGQQRLECLGEPFSVLIRAREGDSRDDARSLGVASPGAVNPADFDEEEPGRTFRQPVRQRLNDFLSGEFFKRDGRNTLFVLSDAGMGKSSLLMMLKFSHLLHFWPSELEFRLEKLGPETLAALEVCKNHSKTVLLLDALDEDPAAWGRIEQRMAELLHATKSFRQVILTCPYLKKIDVGGRSLLNLNSAPSYRCAHYSIQEFLVAWRLVTDGGEQAGERLRTTDQLVRFLVSWSREGKGDGQGVPWGRLDLAGVDLRGVDLRGADLAGATFEKHGVELVWVPGGEFLLGKGESEHRVRLSPFGMGKFPVTNAQYRRFLEANPGQEEPEFWHDKMECFGNKYRQIVDFC